MKTKILVLLFLFLSVGIAQQNKTESKDSKQLVELQKYPVPLSAIRPVYPEAAKLAGLQGKVFVETTIDENGIVVDTKILKSEQEALNTAAAEAIKQTKFSPGINKQNKKVKSTVVIPINFKLDGEPKAPDLGKATDTQGEISDPDINTMIKVEKMPALVEAGKPVYPEEAKKNNVTGKAFVKVLVDREGNPKKAVVIKSDNEIFNQPAADAAMKSKFTPALQEGKPIAVWVVLPYKFALDAEKK